MASITKGRDIFEHRTFCLVSGASRGLGRCIAIRFAERFPTGSVIVLMARNADGLNRTKSDAQAKNAGVRVRTVPVDLADIDDKLLRQYLAKVFEELNIAAENFEQACVVHNVATIGDESRKVTQYESKDVKKYWDLNLTSIVALNAAFFAMFPPEKVRQRVVVNISSGTIDKPFKTWSLYCAGKTYKDYLAKTD